MIPWWAGLAEVETAGPEGASEHRLRWRDGELHLLAHPDPDAERALAAFGGAGCPCIELLDAWEAAHSTGSVLVVGARRPGEELIAPSAAVAAIAADLARWRGTVAALRDDALAAEDGDLLDRLASLHSVEEAAARRRLGGLLLVTLDRRLQHRLQASVAAALGRAAANLERASSTAAMLTAATASRALAPLQATGWTGGIGDVELGVPSRVEAGRAVLPRSWVAAVWGRNLADAVPGHVVLDVTAVTPDGSCTVLAAAPGKPQVEIRVDRWENA